MIIKFLSQAKSELIDAVEYYEGELSGLGHRFWDELDQHIAWIERNHEVPRLRPGGYRRGGRRPGAGPPALLDPHPCCARGYSGDWTL